MGAVGEGKGIGVSRSENSIRSSLINQLETREEAINKASVRMLETSREQMRMLLDEVADSTDLISKLQTENRSLTRETTKLREGYVQLKRLNGEQAERLRDYERELNNKNRLIDQQARELDNTKRYLENALSHEQDKHEQTRKDLSLANIVAKEKTVELESIRSDYENVCEELKQVRETNRLKQTVMGGLESEVSSLKKKLENSQAENMALSQLREKLASSEETKNENFGLKTELERLESEVEKLTETIKNLTEENAYLKSTINQLNGDMDVLSKSNSGFNEKANKVQEQLELEQLRSKQATELYENVRNKTAELERNVKTLQTALASTTSELESVKMERRQKEVFIQQLQTESDTQSNRLRTLEQACNEINRLLTNLVKEILTRKPSVFSSSTNITETRSSNNICTVLNEIKTNIEILDGGINALLEAAISGEKLESTEVRLRDTQTKADEYVSEINKLQEYIRSLQTDIAQTTVQKNELEKELNQEKVNCANQSSIIAELNEKVMNLKKAQEESAGTYENQTKQLQQLEAELVLTNGKLEEYKQNENVHMNSLRELSIKNKDLTDAITKLNIRMERAETENIQFRGKVMNLTNVTQQQEKIIDSQQANINALKRDKEQTASTLITENSELRSRLNELSVVLEAERQDRLDKARSRMDILSLRVNKEEDLVSEIQSATPKTSSQNISFASPSIMNKSSLYYGDNINSFNAHNSITKEQENNGIQNQESKSTLVQSILYSPSPKLVTNVSRTMNTEELKNLINRIDEQTH